MKKLIHFYEEGCILHEDFFTGAKAWYTPGRNRRPFSIKKQASKIEKSCPFCKENRNILTPLKSCHSLDESNFLIEYPCFEDSFDICNGFIRVGNLYEIVPYEFWKGNFDFTPKKKLIEWRKSFLDRGKDYLINVLEQKLGRKVLEDELTNLSEPLFFGSHDVIIYPFHNVIDESKNTVIAGPGTLSLSERKILINATIKGLVEIHMNNPFVNYVCVFENYLPSAGASILHPHRQLVGAVHISDRVQIIANLISKFGTEILVEKYESLKDQGMIVSENETAYCSVLTGSTHPGFEVVSKDITGKRPEDYSNKEKERIAELLQSCHNIVNYKGCSLNEEWFYRPFTIKENVPWEIRIRYRESVNAGFEGGMGISVLPHSPYELKEFYEKSKEV